MNRIRKQINDRKIKKSLTGSKKGSCWTSACFLFAMKPEQWLNPEDSEGETEYPDYKRGLKRIEGILKEYPAFLNKE